MEHFLREVKFDSEGVDFSRYPFDLPAVRNFKRLEFNSGVTFIIGENGAGKSTMIEAIAIACGLNPEGGSRSFQFSTRDTHSDLSEHLTVVRGARRPKDSFFLRAESFYNVISKIEDYGVSGYGDKSLHAQSHGESFMALMEHRFRANSLYIMDEPEAALSIRRQMRFIALMNRLIKERSQLIIATHSPIILSFPGALIYEVTLEGWHQVDYEDTDQYQLTKYFLGNYQKMLGEILG